MATSDLRPLLENIVSRLATIEAHLGVGGLDVVYEFTEIGGGDKPAGAAVQQDARFVRAFDEHSREHLQPFVDASTRLGGAAAEVGALVAQGWAALRGFLVMASKCKPLIQADMGTAVGPISAAIRSVNACVQRGTWENHTRTCSEGIQALTWITVSPAPTDFVDNFVGASDFWGNKIRRDFKGKDENQIAFCNSFKDLILGLKAYVHEHHTTGVAFNTRGGVDFANYSSAGASTTAEAARPAAEAKPSAASAAGVKPAASSGGGDVKGLFGDLSKGGAITSGLKKVTKDMQTWRSEYKSTGEKPVERPKEPEAAAVARGPTTTAARASGPPRCEYQAHGMRWMVENQTRSSGVVSVTVTDMKQSVHILNCDDASIDIHGKAKSISIDGCKKTRVLFDSAMAACELVNCQRMQIQCRLQVPSISIDKTDGCLVFINRDAIDTTTIVSSKSSEMNVSLQNESGDVVDAPIPEQFVHHIRVVNGKPSITSDVSDLYSH